MQSYGKGAAVHDTGGDEALVSDPSGACEEPISMYQSHARLMTRVCMTAQFASLVVFGTKPIAQE